MKGCARDIFIWCRRKETMLIFGGNDQKEASVIDPEIDLFSKTTTTVVLQ